MLLAASTAAAVLCVEPRSVAAEPQTTDNAPGSSSTFFQVDCNELIYKMTPEDDSSIDKQPPLSN
jgi:hypothetical protein